MGQGSGVEGQGYQKLNAWKRADDLAVLIVTSARKLRGVDPWLLNQLKRSATSVPANIAEGYSRLSLREYLHHLSIARASLAETEYWLHFLARLGDISDQQAVEFAPMLRETGSLLYGLIRSLAAKLNAPDGQRQGNYQMKEPTEPYGRDDIDDIDLSNLDP